MHAVWSRLPQCVIPCLSVEVQTMPALTYGRCACSYTPDHIGISSLRRGQRLALSPIGPDNASGMYGSTSSGDRIFCILPRLGYLGRR